MKSMRDGANPAPPPPHRLSTTTTEEFESSRKMEVHVKNRVVEATETEQCLLEERIDLLYNIIADKDNEIERKSREIQTKGIRVASAEATLEREKVETIRLRGLHQHCIVSMKELRSNSEKCKVDQAVLTEALAFADTEIIDLKSVLEVTKEDLVNMKREVENLRERLPPIDISLENDYLLPHIEVEEELARQIANLGIADAQQKLEKVTEKSSHLIAELKQTKLERDEAMKTSGAYMEELCKTRSALTTALKERDEAIERSKSIQSESERAQSLLENQARADLVILEEKFHRDINDAKFSCSRALSQLRNALQDVKKERAATAQAMEEVRSSSMAAKRAQAEVQKAQSETDRLRAGFKAAFEEMRRELEEAEADTKLARAEVSASEARVIEIWEKRLERKDTELNHAKSEAKTARQESDIASSHVNELKTQIAFSKERENKLMEEIQDLNVEMKVQQAQMERLNDSFETQYADYKLQLSQSREENSILLSHLSRQKVTVREHEGSQVVVGKRISQKRHESESRRQPFRDLDLSINSRALSEQRNPEKLNEGSFLNKISSEMPCSNSTSLPTAYNAIGAQKTQHVTSMKNVQELLETCHYWSALLDQSMENRIATIATGSGEKTCS